MAKTNNLGLAPETLIDVVAISKTDKSIDSIVIAEMTVTQWVNFKKKSGFMYYAYQKNYQQFKKVK